jgi:hypothetical protein
MEAILIIIGVIVLIAIVIVLYNRSGAAPEFWFGLFSFLDCCSSIGVFGVTLVITVGMFLLWHSLLLAGLIGGGVLTMLFLVLSMAAASSRLGRQSSLNAARR